MMTVKAQVVSLYVPTNQLSRGNFWGGLVDHNHGIFFLHIFSLSPEHINGAHQLYIGVSDYSICAVAAYLVA